MEDIIYSTNRMCNTIYSKITINVTIIYFVSGMINVTEGFVNWNTTVFRRSNVTYEIIVKLEMPDRDSCWGGLQIVLLEHIPPIISVE